MSVPMWRQFVFHHWREMSLEQCQKRRSVRELCEWAAEKRALTWAEYPNPLRRLKRRRRNSVGELLLRLGQVEALLRSRN